jgi:hypothetical protein
MQQFFMGSYPCYQFQLDDTLVDEVLTLVKDVTYISKGHPSETTLFVPSNMPTSKIGYIGENYNFQSFYHANLYNILQDCSSKVAKQHFKDFDLKICDLWTTKSPFGHYSDYHNHQYSMFSGLLYLTDTTRSQTVFSIPDMFYEAWSNFMGQGLIKQTNEYKVSSEKGKLIIWPSLIKHKISTHTDKETRYTIAFNTMLNGVSHLPTARLQLTTGGAENKFYE